MEFSRPEYWSVWPFPSPGDLPNPGIEPRSLTLQADSLPAEPPGKPESTGMGSLSLLQGIFPTQELNQGLLHGVARITPHHIRAFSFTLASTLSCHWKWRGSVELCQVCIGLEPPRRGSEPHTASITPITASGGLAVHLGRDPEAPLKLGKGNILPFLDPDHHRPICFKILLL